MSKYIDREEAKRELRKMIEACVLDGDHRSADCFRYAIDILDDTKTEDVASVVHGKWINYLEPDEDENRQCNCSVCNAGDIQREGTEVPYCWKCGAKMDLEG